MSRWLLHMLEFVAALAFIYAVGRGAIALVLALVEL